VLRVGGRGIVGEMSRQLSDEIRKHAYPKRSRGGGPIAAVVRPAVNWLDLHAHADRKLQHRAILNLRAPPPERLMGSDGDPHLREYLERLPARERAAVRLSLGIGGALYSLEEIGEKLGVSGVTARKLLKRSLEHLNDVLEEA